MRSVVQVFPPMIFFGNLLHKRFSSIDEICCASVSCGIELCSAISPSPSSFVEHLGFQFYSLSEEIGASLWTSHYEMLQMVLIQTRFEIEAPTHQRGFQLHKVVDSILHKGVTLWKSHYQRYLTQYFPTQVILLLMGMHYQKEKLTYWLLVNMKSVLNKDKRVKLHNAIFPWILGKSKSS
nr:uncharacterized protein LOC112784823 isoform X1 [Arachis hypogaea]XP_029152323.1 uncharacterized protein LOC112784823 isoform X1 [Arachis hypogaea]XP_029152324.1 uncharacterized protein LOC112784823 isoform X1 [Arachis hypogaea]